jgi:hypothetical protein
MVCVDTVSVDVESVRCVAEPWLPPKTFDCLGRRVLTGVDADQLYVFALVFEFMNMLDHEDFHELTLAAQRPGVQRRPAARAKRGRVVDRCNAMLGRLPRRSIRDMKFLSRRRSVSIVSAATMAPAVKKKPSDTKNTRSATAADFVASTQGNAKNAPSAHHPRVGARISDTSIIEPPPEAPDTLSTNQLCTAD